MDEECSSVGTAYAKLTVCSGVGPLLLRPSAHEHSKPHGSRLAEWLDRLTLERTEADSFTPSRGRRAAAFARDA